MSNQPSSDTGFAQRSAGEIARVYESATPRGRLGIEVLIGLIRDGDEELMNLIDQKDIDGAAAYIDKTMEVIVD